MADTSIKMSERAVFWAKSLLVFIPVSWILDSLGIWFCDNKLFMTFLVASIFLNMLLGAIMNLKIGKFNWKVLMEKTVIMVFTTGIVYLTIEGVISVAGQNVVTQGFRAALQIATLMFPVSKIAKNSFILTNGKYPPKWLMQKIYNFQENGDLSVFSNSKNNSNE